MDMNLRLCIPVNISDRLELFVDDYLIDNTMGHATYRLHQPVEKSIIIEDEQPWKAKIGYLTVFQDRGLYRMYYRTSTGRHVCHSNYPLELLTCYEESTDGIHWNKPELGICEFNGSRANNIVWDGGKYQSYWENGTHNFVPFLDNRPDCPPHCRYKAVAMMRKDAPPEGTEKIKDLMPFQSEDGLHWDLIRQERLITGSKFDSQNLAFYDTVRREYRFYYRDYVDRSDPGTGRRDIKTSTSPDFHHCTEGQWLSYPGSPDEQLYTNQIMPYYRAPHIFLGFPTRVVPERDFASEGLFMSSRDGLTFRRREEAIIRPGLNPARWSNRGNYIWNSLVETESDTPNAPRELSLYTSEGHSVRRFTFRMDGFVSLSAPMSGGECLTRPLLFSGRELVLNVSTTARGSLRIEIQDEHGIPIPGFTLADSDEFYGDTLAYIAKWKGLSDLGRLSGRPVRLRFILKDADLYSLRFP